MDGASATDALSQGYTARYLACGVMARLGLNHEKRRAQIVLVALDDEQITLDLTREEVHQAIEDYRALAARLDEARRLT